MTSKKKHVKKLAEAHNLSPEAVEHVWQAMVQGRGTMAQFNHPELGGMGQWQAGGMLMIGDMFNNQLKATVDSLCRALSPLVIEYLNSEAATKDPASWTTHRWWPEELGQPDASGGQNELRYAYFAQAKRLVVAVGDRQTVYKTGKHRIHGISQQNGSLHFNSQLGSFKVEDLKVAKKWGDQK